MISQWVFVCEPQQPASTIIKRFAGWRGALALRLASEAQRVPEKSSDIRGYNPFWREAQPVRRYAELGRLKPLNCSRTVCLGRGREKRK